MLNGKPFSDVLAEINNGQFLSELTDAVYELTKAVNENRKAGKLTVTLNIKPTARDVVSIAADFSSKKPEEGRPETTFFVGKDNSLQRKDPKQPDLPLKEVPRSDAEPLRAID